jgi:hypothetical protein
MGLSLSRYLHLKLLETDDLRKLQHARGGSGGSVVGGSGGGGSSSGGVRGVSPPVRRGTPSNKVGTLHDPMDDPSPQLESAEVVAGRGPGGFRTRRDQVKEGSREQMEVVDYTSFDAAASPHAALALAAAAAVSSGTEGGVQPLEPHRVVKGRRGVSGLVTGGAARRREDNPLLQQLDDLQNSRARSSNNNTPTMDPTGSGPGHGHRARERPRRTSSGATNENTLGACHRTRPPENHATRCSCRHTRTGPLIHLVAQRIRQQG